MAQDDLEPTPEQIRIWTAHHSAGIVRDPPPAMTPPELEAFKAELGIVKHRIEWLGLGETIMPSQELIKLADELKAPPAYVDELCKTIQGK